MERIDGEHFKVVRAEKKQTRNGDDYFILELTNQERSLDAKIWSQNFGNCRYEEGRVIEVFGRLEEYNGKISLVLESCQIVNSEEAVDFTPKIPTLVFDIETVGQDFETLDQREQEYLLNNLTVEVEDKEKAKKRTSLFAIFAMVAAIGGWDVEQNKGKVLMATKKEVKLKNKNFIFQSCGDEKQLLEEFWKESLKFKKFVTYNGSSFDFPFLIIRSGVNRVKVPMSIKRYDNNFIDLQEKIRQKHGFKLEFLCRAFGIDNPKEMGIDGEKVSELYQEGKFQEIANYVAADVTATVQLYQTWKEFMSGER